MWQITKISNTIQFSDGQKTYAFPLNRVWLKVNAGDNESIDVKLAGSRQTIISFNYKDCNLSGQTPYETLNNLINIL